MAENSQPELKPILNAWQSALVTALVMVGLFFLAERGLHALWKNGWLGNNDIYLLVVFGALGALILIIGYPRIEPLPEQTQLGDAHWATLDETRKSTALLSDEGGIPLGYARDKSDPAREHWRKLSYSGDRHLVTIAPNRSGKGTTAIIPTLLEDDASCFVLDPKGENAAITARQRQRLGHQVFILNPFRELEPEFAARGFPEPHRFNPLATLDPTARNFVASAARLAEALVFNESKDPHWSDSARSLVECLILYVCIEPDETRSLGRVRELLTDNPDQLKQMLARMATSSYRPLRQKVGQFLATTNEISSIISAARTQTKDLDDPAIVESLSGDDFRFSDLKRRKMTVYLVLAGQNMKPYARWLRLLLTSALNELMASAEKGPKPVLFLLDEFATLGNMSVLEGNMAYFAGFGIQLWSILQDLNQLEDLYEKRWESFLSNAGAVQFFTPNDQRTAGYISDRCGVRTVYTASMNFNSGAGNQGGSQSTGYSVTQTPRIYPHQLYDLPQTQEIIFHHGMSFPIRSRRWPYHDHDTSIPGATDYTGLYDANPYWHGSQTGGGRADDDAGKQQRSGDQSRNGDSGPRHQKMTRAEASEILGLKEGATRDEINAAWRRVIAQVHRDKGGSDYLTRQVNEAREVLLGS